MVRVAALQLAELASDPHGLHDLVCTKALDTNKLEDVLKKLTLGVIAERASRQGRTAQGCTALHFTAVWNVAT